MNNSQGYSKMVINIRIIIIFAVIILLIILLALELKIVELKKDKKEENEKGEKPLVDDKSYSDLKEFITSLFDEFEKKIIELLKGMNTLDNREEIKPETSSVPGKEDVQISSKTDALSSCIQLYNEVIKNSDRQGEFHKTYSPMRADLKNDQERRLNPGLEPEFKRSDSGKYYVVEIQDSGSTKLVVFPMFDLTISYKNYEVGAWGEVFQCTGYESGHFFKVNEVKSPAYFSRDKDTWRLAVIGELYLVKK
jgi:hypothetical protein